MRYISSQALKLGHWTLTFNTETLSDSLLLDHVGLPFTTEVDRILTTHRRVLFDLIYHPETRVDEVPALQYLKSIKRPFTCSVPYMGGLADDDGARINNWFHVKTEKKSDIRKEQWMLLSPVAHAATLLLASRMEAQDEREGVVKTETYHSDLLQRAWSRQQEGHGKTPRGAQRPEPVDVDREAVGFLEDRMFTQSKAAGPAGNQQWGLDAGPHQDHWHPYSEGPEEWAENPRAGNLEAERKVSTTSSSQSLQLTLFEAWAKVPRSRCAEAQV